MFKTISLKKNEDFLRLYKKGSFYVGKYIILYIKKNDLSTNRIGITVSKKVGKSVVRNRVRRLIRENYRFFELFLLNSYDFVFVARKSLGIPNFSVIKKEMKYLVKKLNVLDKETKIV